MGSHRSSVRREIRSAERGLRKFQLEIGDVISWFEFDAVNSGGGDTYQEGSIPNPFDPTLQATGVGLRFKTPVAIPAIWIRFMAPDTVQTEEGEYTVNKTTLRIARSVMTSSGLQDPLDPAAHFNDRYLYNGFLYRVETYTPRGWLHGAYLMVDISGRQLKSEELESDTFLFDETVESSVPWTPGQQLNWAPTQLSDEEGNDWQDPGTTWGEGTWS